MKVLEEKIVLEASAVNMTPSPPVNILLLSNNITVLRF